MKNSYGLIGERLSHSISPLIHELIFKYSHIEGEYELFELQKEELYDFIKASNLKGFNVTIPYKREIIQYLDSISTEAEAIGAVNAVSLKNGELKGYNTDYYGIGLTFKKIDILLNGASAVILGSGGASAAVLQYLTDNKCDNITIVVRDKNKLKTPNYIDYNIISYDELYTITKKEILINCTPVGMYPKVEEAVVSSEFVQGFDFVFDLIYNPLKTKLLGYAETYNIKNSNGLLMLIAQAVHAEAIWNDISTSEGLIDKIYNELIIRGI